MEITLKIEAKELTEAILKLANSLGNAGLQGVTAVQVAKPEGKTKRALKNKATEEKAEATVDEANIDDVDTAETEELDEKELRKKAQSELTEIARSGKQKELKNLLSDYKVIRLSDIPLDQLDEFVEKARHF